MKGKRNRRKPKLLNILILIFLCLLVVVYIAPLLWMLSVSFKTNAEIFKSPFSLPEVFQWENYKVAWNAGRMGRALLNSTILCTLTLILSMLIGAMAAFGLGRMKWKFAGPTMTYFLIGMMIPVHCVLIPLFVRFAKMNMTDNLFGLLLPYVTFSLPITIFILTGFFKSMQNELFEAACIDGCSVYGCFFKIGLPLCKTGMFVTGLMTFVSNWNELLLAMVFISDKAQKTLPVTLTFFVSPYATNYVQMFAAIVIAILPTILVYSCFSNQIVEGLTTGAVKG